MAGTIITDKIESDGTYDSKIELVSPVLVSNTFAVKSTGGTGNFNIVGANTNTDRTFTLPDGSGALYNQSNILGTVSQSGGVPTGAIIESGSNANGSFTKYADGTVLMSIRGEENRSTTGVTTTNMTFPIILSQNLSSGFGGVTATINSTVPATAINISVSGTNSATSVDIRIDRTTATNTLFYVFVYGVWF